MKNPRWWPGIIMLVIASNLNFFFYRGCYLLNKLFKQLNGFGVDFLVSQSVFGLVKKHKSIFFVQIINQDVLVQSIGFAKHPLEIIPVHGVFEVFFRNGNTHF